MKLSLLVMTPGKQEGKVLEIKLSQFVIGRDPQCHLRPASPLISKRHCALIQRDGKAFLRDFDSTNGTILNESPLKGEAELKNGDILKIGPIIFKVQLEVSPPINRATPAPPTKGVAPKVGREDETPLPKTRTPEPKPAKKPAPPASEGGSSEGDDDIAALLLSLGDGDSDSPSASEDIPEGSTVMDMRVPSELVNENNEPAKAKEPEKPKAPPVGNTSSAAKAILEKYMRRPRS